MPIAVKATPEDRQRAQARAREWKEFRRTFLYSQGNLAHALHCSRRTVCAIENARESIRPRVELLRRFRDLKSRQQRINGPAVQSAYANVNQLGA